MHKLHELLRRLCAHNVRFALIGGMGVILHGGSRVTSYIDVVAPLDEENLHHICAALGGLNCVFYQHLKRMPAQMLPEKFKGWRSIYLQTELGIIDILGELPEWPQPIEQIIDVAEVVEFAGMPLRVMKLESLLKLKASLPRPRDRDDAITLGKILLVRQELAAEAEASEDSAAGKTGR